MSVRDPLPITLLPPGSLIFSSGSSNPVSSLKGAVDIFLELVCSGTPAGGTPTLDVYLQTSVDGGVTWQDIAHTQFAGTPATQFIQIRGGRNGQQNPYPAMTAQLPLGQVVQGPWGDTLRAQWVLNPGGAFGNYTLGIQGYLK